MWMLSKQLTILLIFVLVIIYGEPQEDSLRSAVNAVDRRQRDLNDISDYSENDPDSYYYSSDDNDLAFLKPTENNNDDSRNFQRALATYIEEEEDRVPSEPNYNQDSGIKKRFSSSFRERIENDKTKQRGELAELLLNRLENEHDYEDENEEYVNLMNKLSKAYNAPQRYESQPKVLKSKAIKKRYYPGEYYTNLGYGSVGLKKRSRYYEPDGPSESLYLVNYAPKDDIFERLREEDLQSSNDDWNQQEVKQEAYPHLYSMKRFFPVVKRGSPSVRSYSNELIEHKRASKRNIRNLSTDPKVVKELSSIFGPSQSKSESKTKKVIKRNNSSKSSAKNNSSDALKHQNESSKEVVLNVTYPEKLKIKKKSVNWEDYFGYDRKKKSNDLDHEWLMERYHKAIAMSTKRSSDYPLKNFRSHDEDKFEKKGLKVDEQEKFQKMDDKLKYIEDVIVDDALKYTGAHEGVTDSEEIQEIKDKVISRLAAAYNLEKMRQALGEYKQSIRKQKQQKELNDDKVEEKRVSVPRKQAVDEEREKTLEGDNNIKCALEGGDCDEQTYKTPKEILDKESLWTRGECPKIEQACNEVAEVLGSYGPQLKQACYMHQACLLCGSNSWFAPTRECNILFIAKADELCEDNRECQQITRHSVRYLLDVNRSLRAEPTDGCDLVCSEDRL